MLRRIFVKPVSGKMAVVWAMLLWLILVGLATRAVAAPPSPAAVVAQLQQKIIEAWRSGASFEQRFQILAPAINATHDLETMARFTLGNHWEELNPAQRKQFLATFRRLTIATYADHFSHYDGEHFVQSGHRELSHDRFLVRTHLVQSGGTQMRLDYLLHQQGDKWKIINVLAEGVSELAIKRSQYTEFIQDHGFAALIKELQRKIANMADKPHASLAPSFGRGVGMRSGALV